jgi:excisionase family DNA binding protein
MKKNATEERRTLTAGQVIQKTGLGRDRIYAALRSGELPSIKSGKKFVVPDLVFERWLSSCGRPIQDDSALKELVGA